MNRAAFEADPIPSFRGDVIDRALMHGQWHIDGGIARGIEIPEVDAAESLFMTALLALGEAEGEADREAALQSAHVALSEWKGVLEALVDGPDSGYTHQCIEVDQGSLRSLLRCIGSLDFLASEECKTTMTREQILLDLACTLFACPAYPDAEDVA